MKFDVEGYERLAEVLQQAYDQAARGKGKERHANGLPFHEQPMQVISDLVRGDAGLAFQSVKKIVEGIQLPTQEAVERELLGAINYIAGIIIWRRRKADQAAGTKQFHGACPNYGGQCNCAPGFCRAQLPGDQ